MHQRYEEVPWEEVDGASFFYSKEHYAPVGRDLMGWSVAALDWIDETFPRDARVRRSMRRFIPVFLHHIESDKLTADGRQFALLPLKTIMKDMGVARLTAKETVDRFTLLGKYEAMRVAHSPILEVLEETVPGARAGEWGFGYAPVMILPENPGSVSPEVAEPGAVKPEDTAPGMDEPGSASGDAGSVSIDPGSISFGPGTVSPDNDDLSVSTDIAANSACDKSGKDFDSFLRLFPKGAGVKRSETMERYNMLVGMGISPEALYDSAVRHLDGEAVPNRSRYPLHYLNREEVVDSLVKGLPWRFDKDKLKRLPDEMWMYLFPGCPEFVRGCRGASREEATQRVMERAREKGLL